MSSLTKDEKKLRNMEKKLRKNKPKEGSWDMNKIQEIEEQINIIKNKIHQKNKKTEEKDKLNRMNDEEIINHFKCDNIVDNIKIDNVIPNNRKTRVLRKKIIKKLQEYTMSEYLNAQLSYRIELSKILNKESVEE